MSFFICDSCYHSHDIFSNVVAKNEAGKYNIDFLGEIPIDINLRIQSDEGKPACIANADSDIANIYFSIARAVHKKLIN